MRPYISIVIPTLNEQGNMHKLLKEIHSVIKNYNYEIIIVDGHSRDNTVKFARQMGALVMYDDIGKGSRAQERIGRGKGQDNNIDGCGPIPQAERAQAADSRDRDRL